MTHRRFCIVIALALFLGFTWLPYVSAELKISGYTQARFYSDAFAKRDGDSDKFDIRRAMLTFTMPINDSGTVARLQVDLGELDDSGDGSVELAAATITHSINDMWTARIGFDDIEFGMDINYSSARRFPFERSEVARRLLPGGAETALYAFYQSKTPGRPEVAVGYSNDLRDWAEKNDMTGMTEQHAWVGRVEWPLANNGCAGVSYMRAHRTGVDDLAAVEAAQGLGPVTSIFRNSVFGLHARYVGINGLNLQAEYFTGDSKLTDIKGWYGTLEYCPAAGKTTWFYRYDKCDIGTATDYGRHTLGAAMDVADNSRFTVQYEDIDRYGEKGSNYGLQWQVSY
jgi:hypothetical protein